MNILHKKLRYMMSLLFVVSMTFSLHAAMSAQKASDAQAAQALDQQRLDAQKAADQGAVAADAQEKATSSKSFFEKMQDVLKPKEVDAKAAADKKVEAAAASKAKADEAAEKAAARTNTATNSIQKALSSQYEKLVTLPASKKADSALDRAKAAVAKANAAPARPAQAAPSKEQANVQKAQNDLEKSQAAAKIATTEKESKLRVESAAQSKMLLANDQVGRAADESRFAGASQSDKDAAAKDLERIKAIPAGNAQEEQQKNSEVVRRQQELDAMSRSPQEAQARVDAANKIFNDASTKWQAARDESFNAEKIANKAEKDVSAAQKILVNAQVAHVVAEKARINEAAKNLDLQATLAKKTLTPEEVKIVKVRMAQDAQSGNDLKIFEDLKNATVIDNFLKTKGIDIKDPEALKNGFLQYRDDVMKELDKAVLLKQEQTVAAASVKQESVFSNTLKKDATEAKVESVVSAKSEQVTAQRAEDVAYLNKLTSTDEGMKSMDFMDRTILADNFPKEYDRLSKAEDAKNQKEIDAATAAIRDAVKSAAGESQSTLAGVSKQAMSGTELKQDATVGAVLIKPKPEGAFTVEYAKEATLTAASKGAVQGQALKQDATVGAVLIGNKPKSEGAFTVEYAKTFQTATPTQGAAQRNILAPTRAAGEQAKQDDAMREVLRPQYQSAVTTGQYKDLPDEQKKAIMADPLKFDNMSAKEKADFLASVKGQDASAQKDLAATQKSQSQTFAQKAQAIAQNARDAAQNAKDKVQNLFSTKLTPEQQAAKDAEKKRIADLQAVANKSTPSVQNAQKDLDAQKATLARISADEKTKAEQPERYASMLQNAQVTLKRHEEILADAKVAEAARAELTKMQDANLKDSLIKSGMLSKEKEPAVKESVADKVVAEKAAVDKASVEAERLSAATREKSE